MDKQLQSDKTNHAEQHPRRVHLPASCPKARAAYASSGSGPRAYSSLGLWLASQLENFHQPECHEPAMLTMPHCPSVSLNLSSLTGSKG